MSSRRAFTGKITLIALVSGFGDDFKWFSANLSFDLFLSFAASLSLCEDFPAVAEFRILVWVFLCFLDPVCGSWLGFVILRVRLNFSCKHSFRNSQLLPLTDLLGCCKTFLDMLNPT